MISIPDPVAILLRRLDKQVYRQLQIEYEPRILALIAALVSAASIGADREKGKWLIGTIGAVYASDDYLMGQLSEARLKVTRSGGRADVRTELRMILERALYLVKYDEELLGQIERSLKQTEAMGRGGQPAP